MKDTPGDPEAAGGKPDQGSHRCPEWCPRRRLPQGPGHVPGRGQDGGGEVGSAWPIWANCLRSDWKTTAISLAPPPPSYGNIGAHDMIADKSLRIGVYVCHCGSNIAGVVDVEALTSSPRDCPAWSSPGTTSTCARTRPGTGEAGHRRDSLNRVVVAACSPNLHEPTSAAPPRTPA